jgi:hypothetical protein
MSEENILSGRIEKADVFLPFTPSLTEGYDSTPMFRILINVSESASMGRLQLGHYIKINDTTYYIKKKEVSVFTNTEAERVLQYLKRTQREFTIDVRRDKTNSAHQYVEFHDVSFNNTIYTIRDYKVYRSLWQLIEGELYENLYSPSMERYTDTRLIWYAQLLPQHTLTFSEAGKIKLIYKESQGHLEIYKIEREGEFVLPIHLYSSRENLRFYNHEINGKLDVIPLGSERRIIALGKETQIVSEDHDPVTLDVGQYLLFHPRPQQQNKVD